MQFDRLPERFWTKVNRDGPIPLTCPELGPCWQWTASLNKGYGQYRHEGSTRCAYKVAYVVLIGPVAKGLDLDHLCRNTACVNPGHLEPVTHRVNMLRGTNPLAERARQTHCQHGHPFDAENTLRWGGYRRCRTCYQAWRRAKATA